jgi:hypothetical protein
LLTPLDGLRTSAPEALNSSSVPNWSAKVAQGAYSG